MMRSKKFPILVLLLSLFFTACEEDYVGNTDTSTSAEGSLSIEITDAPIDDSSVEAVFVTVADVRIDGISVDGFSKVTYDVSELRNGQTRLLAAADLEAKSYNQIQLILDYEQDSKGKTPGSYALKSGDVKDKLEATNNAITLSKQFDITAGGQTSLVIDFDLRKVVQRENNNTSELTFASSSELNRYIRLVDRNNTGTIKGQVSSYDNASDEKVIVYAYKKGTFDKETETVGRTQFSNATTSTELDANGNYELHFLESGAYEVVFISYEDTNQDGQFELAGEVQVSNSAALDLSAIQVDARSTVNLEVSLTSILPF